MKNILLLVHDDPGQEARFQAALDLARALEGHLLCLDVTQMPVIPGEFYAASAEAALLADERERESANRKRLEARLAREDVPWTWTDVTASIAFALTDAARMADIVVVNRQLDSSSVPDMRTIASQVVIGSDTAVVAVPEDGLGFDAGGLALVAWDGSGEAMKALQAGTALLRLASNVIILEIRDGSVEIPAEEAAAYLSRHDIHPRIVRRPKDILPVADTILAEAKGRAAAYVLMGGFGHSRIAETLFGGVSRTMLSESPIPTVMAH